MELQNVRHKLGMTNKKTFHALKDAALESKLRNTENHQNNADPEFATKAARVLELYNYEMKKSDLLDVSF